MKAGVKLAVALWVAMPLGAIADDKSAEQGDLSCIKDITFSQEFLAKYPRAGAACTQVIESNGQKWARFDAKVHSMQPGQATFDFIDNHGQAVANMTFAFDPDAQVFVHGKPKLASNLKKGDEIVVWVPEKRMGFYAKPGAAEGTQQFKLVSADTSTER